MRGLAITRMASGKPELQIPRRGRHEISIAGPGGARLRVYLRRNLLAVLRELGVRRARWDVMIVGDADMKRLHQQTLGIGTTTDVLTFDLRDESGAGEGTDVDLDTVICVDEARRRGREIGQQVREELLLYCVHSLLHVQGYDDRTAAGAWQMHAREDEILRAAGAGARYAGKREAGRARRKISGTGAR
jgi:probable rRNA maturation factor